MGIEFISPSDESNASKDLKHPGGRPTKENKVNRVKRDKDIERVSSDLRYFIAVHSLKWLQMADEVVSDEDIEFKERVGLLKTLLNKVMPSKREVINSGGAVNETQVFVHHISEDKPKQLASQSDVDVNFKVVDITEGGEE